MKAVLALEDGTWFRGTAAGAQGEARGEVVFNTSMTGYQEVLTDPSYAGQIVTMTAPQIGNYGVSGADIESSGPRVAGFIMRESSPVASNWRAETTLREYLIRHGIVAIAEIDTRALTRKLRSSGVMRGVIAPEVLPQIHTSSFEAADLIPVGAGGDRTIAGFWQQAETVRAGLRNVVSRAIEERFPLVIEGVQPHIKDEILGHAVVSMSRLYNNALPQRSLIDAINKLPVPDAWRTLWWWDDPLKRESELVNLSHPKAKSEVA